MSVILAIILDGNLENVCFAGQVTKGHIFVKNSEKIKIRGIRLEVCGKGRVRWTKGSFGNDEKIYIGDETYLDFAIDVVESRSRESEMYLEPGTRKLAFQFVLPGHVPSSYVDKIGNINYKIKAVIDRPWNIDDTAEISLTVFRLLDLNKEPPHLWEPIVIDREEEARGCCCFCCCVFGVVNIKVTINRGCFVATEEILLSGEIVNQSDSSVSHTKIYFIQKIQYHITDEYGEVHRTSNFEILAEITRPRINKGCTDSWSGIGFVVPLLPASRMDGCRFIDITYGIQIEASINLGDAMVFIPIVIGHTALQNDFQPHAVTSQPLVQMSPMASCQSTFNYPFPEDSCTRTTNNPHLDSSMHPTIHKISNLIPPRAFMMQNYSRLESDSDTVEVNAVIPQ